MKTGFIGTGNLAKALVSGMIFSGGIKKEDILASNRTLEKGRDFAKDLGGIGKEVGCYLPYGKAGHVQGRDRRDKRP